MNFNSKTTAKEIALSDPSARHILDDAGIDYCCNGEQSLQEACLASRVSEAEILSRLRQSGERLTSGESEWVSAPLAELTKHIRECHHQYVRDSIPRLSALLAKIRVKHGISHPELDEIGRLFGNVAREMLMHMQKEEQILFPFIDALERAANGNGKIEPPFFQTVKNPIQVMMKEHDSAGQLMREIRIASKGYQASGSCTSYQAAYQGLEEFEKNLHLHVHLENNILFPRALKLETAVTA